MDSGEVIPGLNEPWTFAGCKLMEWMSGFVMLICVSEFLPKATMAKYMPILLGAWMGTTFGMAALRKLFPDEERGLANRAMVMLGIAPPGIPAPAAIQPLWSAAPLRNLDDDSEYMQLELFNIFLASEEEEDINIY